MTGDALKRLEPLLGEWRLTIEADDGGTFGGATTTFAWDEDGTFLVQRADLGGGDDLPPEWAANAPRWAKTVTGVDDATGRMTQLYADARGVFRLYEMSLENGVWKVWRDAPGFHQRFVGRFGEDGRTIDGAWERSEDGETWERDFGGRYERI